MANIERGELIYKDEKELPKGWRTLAIICGIWVLIGSIGAMSGLILGFTSATTDLDLSNMIFLIVATALPVVLGLFLLMWAFELTPFAIYERGLIYPQKKWGKVQFISFDEIDGILVQPKTHPNRYAYIRTNDGDEHFLNKKDVEEESFDQLVEIWDRIRAEGKASVSA